jgi:serine protease Do
MVALAIGLIVGLGAGLLGTTLAGPTAGTAPLAPATPTAQTPLTTGTFAKLAEGVKPAVINVNTETKARGGRTPLEEFYGEDFYRRFFGDAPERLPRRGLGSGVIIDPSGVALTNAHVVDGATQVEVVTLDGSTYKAKVVGLDKKTDLAVLKLDGTTKTFPYLPLGDSNETKVGDWVIAVGSPFGLQATVTSGIISAKARHLGAGPYDDFLQTDAAINPGNSGGPLVNVRGEVIGINTAIVRGGSGIGFAIPSNLAKRISSELITTGTITRGWLGVALQPLTTDLATSFAVKDKKGALVSDVVPEGPAARAGVKPGDVVLSFGDTKIETPADLARAVGQARPGDRAKLTVWRERAEKTLTITLAQAPTERQAARLGLEVRPVTPEVASELGLRSTEGVVVAGVDEDSAAAAAGIQRGDVIKEVNRHPIKTPADFERLTAGGKPGESLTLRLERGGSSLYVAVSPQEQPEKRG